MVDEDLVAEIRRKAHAYDRHSGCSQSVLLALQEGLSIGDAESFRSATVLSGGIARRGETCGALLGSLMAGREQMEDRPSYVRATGIADEICDGFQEKLREEFGFEEPLTSTLCSEIQEKIYGRPFNLRERDDYDAFLEAGGHSDEGCYKVCGIAAEVAASRLLALRGERG